MASPDHLGKEFGVTFCLSGVDDLQAGYAFGE